eukprot:Gregarina_sp_Poly_1__1106@NODE_1270_length_4528_cov_198_691773_g847_i1_p4_GENE_NODE_1270_length_4528_cov_198_691773_g847_i1NODE_1270_length_4528_cov_198_691773_g847_i1_p4_ORF_typecomplete_len212_score19_47Asp/PF00026_23/1_5e10TAXi_N/PF14543_6/0_00019_NODE_1270_length_4528_cov_198_691773_g847_i138514486
MRKSVLFPVLLVRGTPWVGLSKWARRWHSTSPHSQNFTAFVSPLLNVYNAQYLLRVSVGSSGLSHKQWFTVIPDSGSFDFWLPSVECDDQCPPPVKSPLGSFALPFAREFYNMSQSSLAMSTGERKLFSYGDGTRVETIGTTDFVSLSGHGIGVDNSETIANLAVNDFAFHRAITFRAPPKSFLLADGLIGFANSPASYATLSSSYVPGLS